jgi:hypothetical protein
VLEPCTRIDVFLVCLVYLINMNHACRVTTRVNFGGYLVLNVHL